MPARPYRSIYAYAWDIADAGVGRFVEEMLELGVTDVSLATSYHAGKFLRPHAALGARVIFPEDGVVYFDPSPENYGKIQPRAHSDARLRAVLPALLADGRLRVHGWTVLFHNTRLGGLHPEATAQNAFGDRYVYSLCPMHADVYDYALTLCRDLTQRHALASLVLETPGWLPYAHGYHHEFAQLPSNTWLDAMLGHCFCDACRRAAEAEDLPFQQAQAHVAQKLKTYFDDPIELTPQQTQQKLGEDMWDHAVLQGLIALRQRRVTQLVRDIRAALPAATALTVIPTVQRPTSACWLEGSDLAALAQAADAIEVPFYEPSAARAVEDARLTLDAIGQAPDNAQDKIRAILRPGYPDLANGAETADAIKGLQALGIRQMAFYNYGLLPRQKLEQLGKILAQIDQQEGVQHAS